MKYLNYFLTTIILTCSINLIGQTKYMDKLGASNLLSCEIEIGNSRGFLFGEEITKKYFRGKEYRYLNFWRISDCKLEELEALLKNYIDKNVSNEICQGDNEFVRQYFPFINKSGELLVAITLSLLDEKEYLRIRTRLSKNFRSIYDGGEKYFFLMYNSSSNEIVKLSL